MASRTRLGPRRLDILASVRLTGPLMFSFVAISITTLPLVSDEASGAELRPFTLPSQNMEVREYRRSQPQPSTGVVDEQIYKDFETKVENMLQPERDKLLRTFKERRESAQKRQRFEEAAHYGRLITVLEAKP
jgi:hypothetical protein